MKVGTQHLNQDEDPPHLIIPEGDPAEDDFDYSKHPIPTIMNLKGEANFMEWREAVRSCFSYFRLMRFINNTATIPTADTTTKVRLKYLRDRSMAYQVLRQSAEPIMDILRGYGWKDGKDKPQVLYDTIIEVFWTNDWRFTFQDLLSLNAANFDTPRAFLAHYTNIITKLDDAGVKVRYQNKQDYILQALKRSDESWATGLAKAAKMAHPTYSELMNSIAATANQQLLSRTAAVSKTQGGDQSKKSGNHSLDSKDNNNNDDDDDVVVDVHCEDPACGRMHPMMPKHPYHAYCQQHHAGGMDGCWVAHPELEMAYGPWTSSWMSN